MATASKTASMKQEADKELLNNPAPSTKPKVHKPSKVLNQTRVATTTVMQPIARQSALIVQGEDIDPYLKSEDAPEVVFLAENKELMLYVDDYEYQEIEGEEVRVPILADKNKQAVKGIKFSSGMFRTNNPITIEQIREYKVMGKSVLGKTVFEGELPDHIIQKQQEYRRYFTKDPQEHEPNAGGY